MTRKHVDDIKLQKQLLLISCLFLPFSNSCMDITPLQAAILSGNYEKTELLIYHGAQVNECNSQGYAPIHFAATQPNPDIIFLLAKNGADINIPTPEGSPETAPVPLTIAINKHNPLVLKALLACGAHMDWYNIRGETALHLAAASGCMWMVKILVEAGIKLSSTSECGVDPAILAYSKMHDSDMFYQIYDYLTHTAKRTQALITAVQNKKTEDIIEHLKQKSDPSAHLPDGNSLLHFCIGPYHEEPSQADEIAKILICYGANVNDKNLEGDTPLHKAVELQNTRLALLLVTHGANAGMQNKKGKLAMTENLHFWLDLWQPAQQTHWSCICKWAKNSLGF